MNAKALILLLLSGCLLATHVHADKKKDHDTDNRHSCQKEHHAGDHKHAGRFHKMIKKLDLSDEQHKQVKTVFEENKSQREEQHQALRENRKQMHELIASGGYSDAKAKVLADKQGKLMAEMARQKAAEMAKVHALLTPEQQKKFAEMKFDKKDKHPENKKKTS